MSKYRYRLVAVVTALLALVSMFAITQGAWAADSSSSGGDKAHSHKGHSQHQDSGASSDDAQSQEALFGRPWWGHDCPKGYLCMWRDRNGGLPFGDKETLKRLV
jgi:hypothetical protein